MIKFIIVDDKIEFQNQLKKIIRKTIFNNDKKIAINCYEKYSADLQQEINDKSQRKVYLLDIDLETEISGINIALKIREKDWDSEIIFLTSHSNFFEKVYRSICKVFDFIEKYDNMEERLIKDIKKIINQKYDVKMFKYQNRQIDLQIYLKDILYIYRDTVERKLVIVTTNNRFIINKNISDMLKELDHRFIQTHRSCIANKEHITLFKWKDGCFTLDNKKDIFLLSKKYKEQIEKEDMMI